MIAISLRRPLNNRGFAPMIVTIVIITVVALMTTGFVTYMIVNQNSATNRQLNNQAYYAAESGVNDAIQALAGGMTTAKTNCGPIPTISSLANNVLSNGVSYSCLLINPSPTSLVFTDVSQTAPATFIMTGSSGGSPSVVDHINFNWQPVAGVGAFSFPSPSTICSGICFPPQAAWKSINNTPYPGILRVMLTPINSQINKLPSDTSSSYTAFLYPSSTSSTPPAYGATTIGPSSGWEAYGGCSLGKQPDACSVSIDTSSASSPTWLVSISSIYTDSQVTLTATDNNNNPLAIANAQAEVDSTGDAQGVLKRISVRVPLHSTILPVDSFASAETICKDIASYPPNYHTGEAGMTNSSCGL